MPYATFAVLLSTTVYSTIATCAGTSGSSGTGGAAGYYPSPQSPPRNSRLAGVPGRTVGKGKSLAKGKSAGKGNKGGGKGKGFGKDGGKSRRQPSEAFRGAAPTGARPPNGARTPRQSASAERRDQVAEKEAQFDRMFATMQSFITDLNDFTADKLSADGSKRKAAQVCSQFDTASKPKAASSPSADLDNAQRAVAHQLGQQRLLQAACTRRYKELQEKLALLQSVTQHHLPEAKARLAEVAAIHHSEIDAMVSSVSASNGDSGNSDATLAAASGPAISEDIAQLNREIHGSAEAISPLVQKGGGTSSTSAGMSDGSKRRRDPVDEESTAKLAGPKKASEEGSAFYSAAARGDYGGTSDLEDDLDDPTSSDPIYIQLMSEAQAQVLTYGPVGARPSANL